MCVYVQGCVRTGELKLCCLGRLDRKDVLDRLDRLRLIGRQAN